LRGMALFGEEGYGLIIVRTEKLESMVETRHHAAQHSIAQRIGLYKGRFEDLLWYAQLAHLFNFCANIFFNLE
jgi:hypothetical protein